MDTDVQIKIIDKNISLINKHKHGFVSTYCDYIKNQVINNISICDRFKQDVEDIDTQELYNVEKILL